MRISRLELDGFKSFARKQIFDFHEGGVTAVVGPNGCGKSNIVDAIRWVLGERSRKDLRTESSTDVIFAGASGKRPGRYASVTIVFDNSDGQIPQFGAEFSVTRKLSTTGESNYWINGQEAKRRDIADLFKGTGVGPDGYTVMGQGKIDELLRTNPVERRKVFEEASGISTYRAQKISTQAKLEVVAQNLERLQEKIKEAKNRLATIKGQASRALKHREYTTRLKLLRTQLALKQFHRLGREREDLLIKVNDLGREEGRLHKAVLAARMEAEGLGEQLRRDEEALNDLRSRAHNAELEAGRADGRRNEALARVEGLKRSAERLEDDIARVQEQIAQLEARKSELNEAIANYRQQLDDANARLADAQREESAVKARDGELEQSIKRQREQHLMQLHTRSQLLNEQQRLESDLKNAGYQQQRLNLRAGELDTDLRDADARVSAASATHEAEKEKLATLRHSYHEAEEEITGYNTSLGTLRAQRHELELRISGDESRVRHLESIERMLEGVEQGSRRLVQDDKLRERFGVKSLVADALQGDIGLAPALERALGELASGIIVDTAVNAWDAVDYLARNEGEAATVLVLERFSKVPAAHRFPTGQGILGPLLSRIRVSEGFEKLAANVLGDWLLVADRDVARRLSAELEGSIRIVTPTGEVFSRASASLPSSDRTGGVVTQRSELERLRKELVELRAEAEKLSSIISQKVVEVQQKNAALTALRQHIYDANVSELEARTELNHLEIRLRREREEAATIAEELKQISNTAQRWRDRLDAIQGELKRADDAILRAEEGIESLTQQRASLDEELRAKAEVVVARRIELAELRSNLGAVESTLKELESATSGFVKRIDHDRAELRRASESVTRLQGEADQLGQRVEELLRDQQGFMAQVNERGEALTSLRTSYEALAGKERQAGASLLELKEQASSVRFESEKRFLAMNQLRERMIAEYDVDLDLAYREYDPEAQQLDEKSTESEVDALQHALRRLGPVNMEAVEELEEVEERFRNHTKQEKDLIRARKALEDAIERIEAEARRRFITTFENARTHFQRLFRKMFGGGSADMMLLNPEDPLESGIEVMAKPPGMEPKSLNLLSGGQRTMIACAMLFALFETSNAPFALLDEVDAALDDANVERFCTLLREYAGGAQFIIITHHKKTMAHADRLYGVTMQEPGISMKVSVDLCDVDQGEFLAEASVGGDVMVA